MGGNAAQYNDAMTPAETGLPEFLSANASDTVRGRSTSGVFLRRLYTGTQCRALDRRAIEAFGIDGFELMRRAGSSAFSALRDAWPDAKTITVLCGKGNNAGDGYIVAGEALREGLQLQVLQVGDPGALQGDAQRAYEWALQLGCRPSTFAPDCEITGDVVVDGLLGSGFRGALRPEFEQAVNRINAVDAPVLALDLPTGVDPETGAVPGPAVEAELTVSFIGEKLALRTGAGVDYAGRVEHARLGVPHDVFDGVPGVPWLRFHPSLLPRRGRSVHKHALGHVVVIGGDHGMGGAPLLAAEAALRAGAGLVSVITRDMHRAAMLARRPELMVLDADDQPQCDALLERAAVVVVGPGLGRGAWGRHWFGRVADAPCPRVVDADALYHLAQNPPMLRGSAVLTPHVGEAARLIGSGAAVRADRLAAARSVLALCEGVSEGAVVLKGAGSVISDSRWSLICGHGNPGMATAGMGDVLSGVIGALLGQGQAPLVAAATGTVWHAAAADEAVLECGEAGLIATDIAPALGRIARAHRPVTG